MFRKKTSLLLVLVLCLLLSACSVNISFGKPAASAPSTASTASAAPAAAAVPTADPALTAPAAGISTGSSTGAPTISPVQGNGQISEDEAKRIALEDAGVKESDVFFTKCKQDFENGDLVWEIEFHVGRTEYEYDISATDGSIVKREMDID